MNSYTSIVMALGKHKLSSFDTDATINLIDWLKSLFERKEVVSKKEIDDITTKLDIIKDCILAKTNITDNSIITSGNSGETTSISQRTPPQDYNQLVKSNPPNIVNSITSNPLPKDTIINDLKSHNTSTPMDYQIKSNSNGNLNSVDTKKSYSTEDVFNNKDSRNDRNDKHIRSDTEIRRSLSSEERNVKESRYDRYMRNDHPKDIRSNNHDSLTINVSNPRGTPIERRIEMLRTTRYDPYNYRNGEYNQQYNNQYQPYNQHNQHNQHHRNYNNNGRFHRGGRSNYKRSPTLHQRKDYTRSDYSTNNEEKSTDKRDSEKEDKMEEGEESTEFKETAKEEETNSDKKSNDKSESNEHKNPRFRDSDDDDE